MSERAKMTITFEGPGVKHVFHTLADAVDFCDEQKVECNVERVVSTMGKFTETRTVSERDWYKVRNAAKRTAGLVLRQYEYQDLQ